MILTTHTLAGAAIGKNVNNVWLVIILSLIVHFILDSFRHGEYFDDRKATVRKIWWKIAIDLGISFLIIYFSTIAAEIPPQTVKFIVIGAFFSLLPDATTLINYLSKGKFFKRIKKFHAWAHRYSRFPKYSPERKWTFRNAINDIIISIIAIIILFL